MLPEERINTLLSLMGAEIPLLQNNLTKLEDSINWLRCSASELIQSKDAGDLLYDIFDEADSAMIEYHKLEKSLYNLCELLKALNTKGEESNEDACD